jgi:subtilisin family serine protease
MSTLDPRLKSLLKRGRSRTIGSPPRRSRAIPERVKITVKFTGALDDLERIGFKPSTVLPHPNDPSIIATGSIETARLEALAAIDHVTTIEGTRAFSTELNKSVPEINAGPGHSPASDFTGEGVVIGIIDTGIDYRHHAFRNPDGTTRIVAIWDQTLDVDDVGGSAPDPFDFGVEYDADAINEAIEAADTLGFDEAFAIVPSKDKRGHGTRVAGIAAGDGSQAGNCHGEFTFVGVAPGAELIVVKRDFGSGSAAVGESDNFVEALRYIFNHPKLNGRPVVINISLGDNQGAHDGTSMVEQAIDRLLLLQPRRAVVKSAGNEADERHHARATVQGHDSLNLRFRVRPKDDSDRFLELWYPGSGTLQARIKVPVVPEAVSLQLNPGDDDDFQVGDAEESVTVTIASATTNADNGDRRITVQLEAPDDEGHLTSGTYTLELTNPNNDPVEFHAWLDRSEKGPKFLDHVSSASTVSIPGTSEFVITVAAYTAEGAATGEVKDSSGRGPIRRHSLFTGVLPLKPEIAAPGGGVTSARANKDDSACSDCCETFYNQGFGTSVAAPHVTGAIALLFEKNLDLDVRQIRRILFESATAPAGDPDPALPNTDWGHGRLDVSAALEKMDNLGPINPVNPINPIVPTNPIIRSGPHAPSPLADGPIRGRTRRPVREMGPLSATPAFTVLRRRALRTPTGQVYASLVSRYFSEVRGLIRSQPRVGVVWQRCGGPQLVRELARRVADADRPFPLATGSVPLSDGLRRFLAVLARYASAELRRDIDRYGSMMLVFGGRSLNEILALTDVDESTRAGVA